MKFLRQCSPIFGSIFVATFLFLLPDAQNDTNLYAQRWAPNFKKNKNVASSEFSSAKIAGWREYVRIFPGNMLFKAKLDTGALTSSIDVRSWKLTDSRGRSWKRGPKFIRFRLKNKYGKVRYHNLPLVRFVRIKRHGLTSQRRPVVMLKICLGPRAGATQFSLTNRSKFGVPILLGRRFLKSRFIVDPGIRYIHGKKCRGRMR